MKPGDFTGDFELLDQTGTPRTLTGLLRIGPVALFFYRSAMTASCTAAIRRFRDLTPDFARIGAHPVGISPDPVERQHEFAALNSLGFPLLSDPDGTVATRFGARRRVGPLRTRRRTYVIDTDRQILDIITSGLQTPAHADTALAVLRAHVPW
ncbi:peroxiredoxin [Kibdelosporangium phytohabitans]|uniref:thioredoxin-dependent peroxiredoxin n=1 Tax=Kibdelosporangium phytohabitans TaxID=860235 RepID=A0A0N9HWP4_9PSEU|nr:peroxiredoxin [Kibdelosporangium phytohabitans]ALG06276.1 peroxiredoxin [Kibdelosporangium phytohabitans]MBE1467379.1 peroxiredoxin Q/BCP [Kibdelosporangium phytohabitans]